MPDAAYTKFGTVPPDDGKTFEPVRYTYPNVWDVQKTTGPDRLVIAAASGHVKLLRDLASLLHEPFGILYVLLVGRGGGDEARYQNPHPLERNSVHEFLREFRDFFEQDGRHDVWVSAPEESATIVYDHHNILYAYGPLGRFETVLAAHGLERGKVTLPVPHYHCYHAAFDDAERKVLEHWSWRRFPLKPGD